LSTTPEINLFGVIAGNPLISVEHMLPHYNDYLNALGFLTAKARRTLQKREEDILSLIFEKDWPEASDLFIKTFFLRKSTGQTFLRDLTGIVNHYNLLNNEFFTVRPELFVNGADVREALHVGNSTFDGSGSDVTNAMRPNFVKSSKAEFEEMLEDGYRVLVYAGQFDVSCAYYLNEIFFNRLSWSGATTYRESNAYPLTLDESLGGHFKQGRNFTHVLVRNAGHLAMADQPRLILGLTKKFAEGVFDKDIQSLDVNF